MDDCNKALSLEPIFALAYLHRSQVLAASKKYKEALEDLNKALTLTPDEALAYSTRGFVEAKLGDKQDAAKDCNKAIALDAACALAYYHRGIVFSLPVIWAQPLSISTKQFRSNQNWRKPIIFAQRQTRVWVRAIWPKPTLPRQKRWATNRAVSEVIHHFTGNK